MLAPKSIRNADQKLSIYAVSEQKKAQEALYDKNLTDDQADTIIAQANRILASEGMPSGGFVMDRVTFRKSWPNMGI